MKILYIHQYFTTPQRGGGTRSYEFARYFVEQGHVVAVITAHNKDNYYVENINGIEVHWIPNYYDNSLGFTGRVMSFFLFVVKSIWVSLKIKDVDICYASSTPLTIGVTAIVLKWIKKIKYVFEVRDLWPEYPIQMGIIKNQLLIKCAYAFEKFIYRNAESIVALSPGMREGIVRYNLQKQVSVIPNCSDLHLFYPHETNRNSKRKYGLDGKFNIVFFGAMGRANGLHYIIEAARIFQEKEIPDVQFLFIGKGAVEKELQMLVEKYNLSNVLFLGFLPKIEVVEIVNACDASIITLLNFPVSSASSPNKLFDSFAAGKACLVNINGWIKQLIEENNCGFYVSPDSPMDLFNSVMTLKNNPALQRQMETNARALAEREFDRKKLAEKLLQQIESHYVLAKQGV
jgi:glycosyltransferase involved in cell wall biosynthesis